MVSGAAASCRPNLLSSKPARLTGIIQVFIVEQLLCVHPNSSTHVQAQLLLEELPLTGQTFLWVRLTCKQKEIRRKLLNVFRKYQEHQMLGG